MRRVTWLLAGFLALLLTGVTQAQYGDISDVKLLNPEDKEDVKNTPAPKDAVVLFDGKSLDNWVKTHGTPCVATAREEQKPRPS